VRFEDLPRIDDVIVDVEPLAALAHRCDPALCRHCQSCCGAGYEVCIEGDELPRVAGAIPLAARYAHGLSADDNPFEQVFADLYALDEDESGLCCFAYSTEAGDVLCSLHTAALEHGLPPTATKPRSCLLWPLAMSGRRPRFLTVDPGAFHFPCNARKEPDGALDPGVAAIVRLVFGEGFLGRLRSALACAPAV